MKTKNAKIIYKHIRNLLLGLVLIHDWKIMKSKFEFSEYGKVLLDFFFLYLLKIQNLSKISPLPF